VLDPVHAELSRQHEPNGEAIQHRQRLVVHQIRHERVIERRVGQIQRLHHSVGAFARRPRPTVDPLELQLNRSRLDPGGAEKLAQSHSPPQGVPHRTVAPLGTGDARLESTPAVPGALIHGRDRNRLEVLYQLVEADLKRPLDIALHVEPPRAEIDGVRDEFQMVAHVERRIRREWRQKIWTWRLELNAAVGDTQKWQLLRIADERVDPVPVRIDARAGEAR